MQTESTNNSVVVEPLGSRYKLRFDDTVTSPSYYRFEFEALSLAQSTDKVSIMVNTDGGSLATGIEVANAIFSCQAEVEGVLRSNCHSCGSIIFLACRTHDVGLASEMLLHSGSGGTGGTPSQSIERAKSYKRQVRSLFETVYRGFLSAEELDQMIDEDKEFIFSGEEIVPRLEAMYKYRGDVEEAYYDKQDEALWQENNLMVAESLSSLDISQEDKDTFNRVKDLLDESMQQEDDSFEEDDKAVAEKNVISYNWCNGITVDATDYPDQSLYLSFEEEGVELLLNLDTMLADRETVIHFLEEITGDKVSRKKGTKVLSLELIALAVKFVLEVQNK